MSKDCVQSPIYDGLPTALYCVCYSDIVLMDLHIHYHIHIPTSLLDHEG